ncbi:MAG: hypothetical protein WCR46_14460 [Deltaproteobacteria bacterium]
MSGKSPLGSPHPSAAIMTTLYVAAKSEVGRTGVRRSQDVRSRFIRVLEPSVF